MTVLIVVLTGLIAAYFAVIHWQVFERGDFQFVHNAFWAWVLVNFMGRMQCITIGSRCYGYAVNWQVQLTPKRIAHEKYHYHSQWCAMPYTFIPRYLYLLAKYGYDKHPWENEARAFAGEPVR